MLRGQAATCASDQQASALYILTQSEATSLPTAQSLAEIKEQCVCAVSLLLPCWCNYVSPLHVRLLINLDAPL
jgi:hypothetical protein